MASPAHSKLTPSLEDYLEAILFQVRESRVARVRDIAGHLNVAMSSVTAALKTLSKRKLVNHTPYEYVTLTDRGREVAETISRRHDVLRRFLTEVLGLDPEQAEANACRMEHAVDETVLERLKRFAQFIQQCPRAGEPWVEGFFQSCSQPPDADRCRACLANAVKQFRGAEDL